jgi:hypothetical protein
MQARMETALTTSMASYGKRAKYYADQVDEYPLKKLQANIVPLFISVQPR